MEPFQEDGNLLGINMTKIKDLPLNERPREKGIIYGVDSLSDGELIAIILSTGTKTKSSIELANEILLHSGGLKKFSLLTFNEFCSIEGINTSKAMKLMASFELAKRINQNEYNDLDKFKSIDYVSKYFINLIGKEKKEFVYVVLYNQKEQVIGIRNVYKGKHNEVSISLKEIIYLCLNNRASSFILLHNHPSGSVYPSNDDKAQTNKLIMLCNIYQLELKDHIIITSTKAYSVNNEIIIE